jgi:hypothetical protein
MRLTAGRTKLAKMRTLFGAEDPKSAIHAGRGEPETGRWFRSICSAVRRKADAAGGAPPPKAAIPLSTIAVEPNVLPPPLPHNRARSADPDNLNLNGISDLLPVLVAGPCG